jgi:glyoxylase-like metal-dependent hydrolase (beta-lactamase superfamily II)
MMCSNSLGGDVDLVEIIEFHAPTHDAQWMLPGLSPHLLKSNASWLREQFWTPRTNRLVFTYQLWLAKMRDAVVLIDTGCGNHKHRVSPYQNQINTPVLDWLAAVGAPAERVTHVLHTHLHSDHVGWNTRLVDGRWVPTFPNATYYLPKLDYDLFTQRRARSMGPEMYEGVFADSVIPVFEAGMTRFVAEGDEVAGLVAGATPGHTPGHLAYTLRVGGGEVIFCGDVLHSPLQVICPHQLKGSTATSREVGDVDEAGLGPWQFTGKQTPQFGVAQSFARWKSKRRRRIDPHRTHPSFPRIAIGMR